MTASNSHVAVMVAIPIVDCCINIVAIEAAVL